MEKKFKKQRRNITIKIASIITVVWLIVSVVLSIAVTTVEKEKLIKEEDDKFYTLVRNIESNGSYLADTYVDILKQPYTYIIDKDKPELNSGADGYFDNNIHIFVLTKNDDGTYSETLDTDKYVSIHDYTVTSEKEHKSSIGGQINYDSFIKSITQEQLDSISEYLHIKKDKDGNYYELICKKFYFDEENSYIIPKTVEIVKTDENHTWYAQDEVIEVYELTPKFTDEMVLYTSSDDDRNIIPGQFVLGTFKSGGLIDTYLDDESYPYLDTECAKVSPFTYVYKNVANAHATALTFVEDEDIEYMEFESDGIYYEVYQSNEPQLVINYAKRINVLDSCKSTLVISISSLFLFFLIIGIILAVMMYKVMKTQMTEEQKRAEVTNALAHDIKTPLFIISGYAQNLKENVNTDKREHYCDRIIERTDEVNELVHKMLDFSNPEVSVQSFSFSSFMLKDITNEVLSNFDELKKSRNIILSTNDTHEIYADKEQIERVIRNLLDNALRYSDEGTDIAIDINEKSFSISNVCSSISSEDIKHLTEPYYRVEKNRNTKGNGLGLSIVKSILDVHGYKLDIKLQNNLITFTITF
ncbi:MAG: HAMP domain-containing histidine kinase [Ruminococcaceae bacterium]|nr:HAMP domain-containing histidine kinase [Oscillospiraceae bacterium]